MSAPVLENADLDQLAKALLSLAREVWVLKDRQRVLEAALEEAGVLAADVVDTWEPDESLTRELAEQRAQFIDGLLQDLVRPATDD
ncbi:MAG: hypothetical protein ACR2P6_11230 [Gammaproteobacteria bacterium]